MRPLLFVCAAGFAFSANYTNHAPLAPALMQEFHFNLAMAGLLTTGIFLTHALMQVPGGLIADRSGAFRTLIAALAVVFAGNLGIAFASSYGALLLWKIFAGLGTGTSFVAGARYLSSAYKGPRLHVAQGYYGGSILLGSGFVIFAVPQLQAAFGWRGAFLATAFAAGVVLLLSIMAAPRIPNTAHPAGRFGDLVREPQLWRLGVIQMASFGLVIVAGAWITVLLRKGLDVGPKQAGMLGSTVLLLGIASRPLGGALAPRTGARRLLYGSLLMSAAACFLLAAAPHSFAAAAGGILLLGVGCGLPYAALFTRAAALFPGRAGAAMGLVNMLGIGMILAGAPLVGHLADWTGNFQSSFLALGAFTIAAGIAIPGIHE